MSGLFRASFNSFSISAKLVRWLSFSLAMVVCLPWVYAGAIDLSPRLFSYVASRWGGGAEERLKSWSNFVTLQQQRRENRAVDPDSRSSPVYATNRLWAGVPYLSDQSNWGMEDYWATPVEVMGINHADCEDYAIAKYFTLKELGVPVSKMRITYVRALRWNEPHMVLAYYPEPDSEPYILDNLTDRIDVASDRRDLEPIYSFNDEDLWTAGSAAKAGKSSQIRLWRGLIEKMDKEQRM